MSVVSTSLVDWSGTITEDFHREYNCTYRVVMSAVTDGPATAMLSTGLPTFGSPYAIGADIDIFAFCRSIGNARRDQSDATRKAWLVDVKYSTKGTTRDPQDQPGDPLSWAWKVRGSFGTGTPKALTKDRTGRAIANSADEPFEPFPEVDEPLLVLQLEKNTRTIDVDTWAEYAGTVNDATLWGLDERCIKLVRWDWDIQHTGTGQSYVANKFEVAIKSAGYYFKPLDTGYREKIGMKPDGKPDYRDIKIDGELTTKPHMLNGSGLLNPFGANPVYFDGLGANPQPFEIEEEKDFGVIFPRVLPGPIT